MITLDVNLKAKATTQYNNFNFNGMVKFGGGYLASSSDGMFSLGGSTDNGSEINAHFEIVKSDMGIFNPKRIRAVTLGYEADGDLTITFQPDSKDSMTYDVISASVGQQRLRVPVAANAHGRYWSVSIANVSGSDFSVDSLIGKIITRSDGIGE